MCCLTYLNFTKIEKAKKFHEEYKYTYFITLKTNYKEHSTIEIFKKLQKYAYNHDENSHIISVKEYTEKTHGLHFHILYFTNKKLDYAKVHKRLPKYADINIQLVKKTEKDIERVLKYMNKNKRRHKQKSKQIQSVEYNSPQNKISIFDFKIQHKV